MNYRMKLTDLTRRYIESFSGSVIFGRGEGYYKTGRVTELAYDEDAATIIADVSGNYGNYCVEIVEEHGGIEADCDCPYDGYPCKHIVAVMLEFVENRDKYLRKVKTDKKQSDSLKARVSELSKEELVEMAMDCARKYPDFKSELMVRFAQDKQEVIDTIRKQIERAFPEPGDSYSIPQIVRRLKTIAKPMDAASDAMKVEVYWAIADRALQELNDYGMSEETLEGIAIDYMRALPPLLVGNDTLRQKKQEILEGLMRYYEWGNSGVTDFIYEIVRDLLENKSDYQIVIDYLQKMIKPGSFSSYYQQLLSGLYEEIGDDEAALRTLESNLEYGMDYWRLAQYWIDRDQDDKALEIVKEGIEKGEGRKEELYLYMQEHYERQNDYDAMLKSLESKIQESPWGYHSLGDDETYKRLMSHYESTDDYAGKVKLLDLRLAHQTRLDLGFYKESEEILRKSDWPDFEERFIARIKKKGLSFGYNYDHLLAEIYDYQGDTDKLWEAVQGNAELLSKYEKKLVPIYPEEYLKEYERIVDRYIERRGRDNYRSAAQYAERIKRLYRTVLKEPERWETYIQNLRAVNKRLRAMQEEFSHL